MAKVKKKTYSTFEEYKKAYTPKQAKSNLPKEELGEELAKRHIKIVRKAVRDWAKDVKASS